MKTFMLKVENVNIALTKTDTFKVLQMKLKEYGIDLELKSMLFKGKAITESSIVSECLNFDNKDNEKESIEFVLPVLPESSNTVGGDIEKSKYLCRLCGSKSEDAVYIFQKTCDIAEKIEKLLPISPISQTDGLSKYVCTYCCQKINLIHDFVQLCVETERKLFNYVDSSDNLSLNTSSLRVLEVKENSLPPHCHTKKYKCPNCKINFTILKSAEPESFDSDNHLSLSSFVNSTGFELNFQKDRAVNEDTAEAVVNRRTSSRIKRNLRSYAVVANENGSAPTIFTRRQAQNHCNASLNHSTTQNSTADSDIVEFKNWQNSKEKRTKLRDIRKRTSNSDNAKVVRSSKRCRITLSNSDDVTRDTKALNDEDTNELEVESGNDGMKQFSGKKCDVCNLDFYAEDRYIFHMKRHETTEYMKDFICGTCNEEFINEDALWKHHYCHRVDENRHRCATCEETFAEESELRYHVHEQNHEEDGEAASANIAEELIDTSKKCTKLTCEACGARFVLRERYEFHMERHKLGSIETFSCLVCDKRFKSENILWDHHQYQHRTAERFACFTCEKTFVKRTNLNYHLKTFGHKGGKLVASPDESREADSSGNVKSPDVGKPRPKITCSECGARFVLQERYEFHMNRHRTGKMDACVCELCGRESTNENVLWDHYQYMHKRTKRYVCTTCGKLFHKQSMLSRHQVKYGHKGTKEVDIVTDDSAVTVDSAAFKKVIAEEVVEMKSVNCVLCGEIVWGVDPNLINDAVTCRNCERPGLSLQVDSDGAKVITRRQYHCNMCNKHFTTKDRLEYHIMRHSENMDEFVCSTCGKELSTEQALFEHYLYVHKGARPHVCELCGKSYQFKARLKEHMRIHSGERPFACEICGQRCMTNNALRSHKRTHITEKRFPCQICKKAFRKRQDLNEHLERHWKNDKTMMLPQVFSCAICLEMFPTFRILKKHMKEAHRVESQDPILTELQPWFECEDCHEKFKHQMSLKVHRERIHEGKMKPVYHCDLCDITYKNARVLSNHVKNKHEGGKRYKCAQCGKEYNQSTSLHNHIFLHTGEKPFSCEHCEMTFRTKESRDYHQRKHTGERPYKCPHCEKAFATTTQRREHRKREHDEGNNHHCPECGKVCFGEHGVRSHLNTHMADKRKAA